jgi:hypothetical protein
VGEGGVRALVDVALDLDPAIASVALDLLAVGADRKQTFGLFHLRVEPEDPLPNPQACGELVADKGLGDEVVGTGLDTLEVVALTPNAVRKMK